MIKINQNVLEFKILKYEGTKNQPLPLLTIFKKTNKDYLCFQFINASTPKVRQSFQIVSRLNILRQINAKKEREHAKNEKSRLGGHLV